MRVCLSSNINVLFGRNFLNSFQTSIIEIVYIASDFLPKINCVCLPTMETVIDETFLYLRHEFVYCGVRSVVGKKVLQTF